MDELRVLHAADLHIDSAMRGLVEYEGAPVDEIRPATRTALRNLVAVAIDRDVHLVLIAGDLYDGSWRDYNTGLFVIGQLAELHEAGIPVALVYGNHDAESQLTKRLRLPPNTTEFRSTGPDKRIFPDLDVAVHGYSFATRAVYDDLSLAYPDADPGLVNIGMLHTCFDGSFGHDPYAPCTAEGLRSKGYDYWALGHVHSHTVVCDDPMVAYPGNLQGRHIGETGPKGVCIVTFVDHEPSIEQVILSVVQWERCQVNVDDIASFDECLERCRDRLLDIAGSGSTTYAIRVELTGATPLHSFLRSRPEQVTNEIRALAVTLGGPDIWIEKVTVSTTPPTERPSFEGDGVFGQIGQVLAQLKKDPTMFVATEDAPISSLVALNNQLRAAGGPVLDDLFSEADLVEALDDAAELLASLLGHTEIEMRVERLDLVAFGNFTDTVIDLSGPGLQVIYGPNETGKSTARAAISNLLYGFDVRTTYAFRHPMNKLQIGALLSSEGAVDLDLVRYKRNKDPLVEIGSNEPVSNAAWAGLLQGVSRADFEAMFTLGWEELISGTAELVAGDGALGETLFAAGLGVRDVGGVLKKLDDEADHLFLPRGSTRIVNTALKAHEEARRRVTEMSVKPTHYASVRRDHEKAVEHRVRIVSRRSELELEHEHLITLRGVLPTLREREQKIEARRDLLAHGPISAAGWAERVQQTLESRSEFTRQRATAAEQVRRAEEKLAETAVDEAILAVAEQVDGMAEKIAGYLEGLRDRGGLLEGRRDADRDARALLEILLGAIPGAAAFTEAWSVLAGKDSFGPIRDEWTRTETAFEHALTDADRVEEEVGELRDRLADLPETTNPDALRDSVEAAVGEGDLDKALSAARNALGNANADLVEVAGRLDIAPEEIDDAVDLRSPSSEEIEEILAKLDETATKSRVADSRVDAEERREVELRRELDTLASEAELPSEADLADHRRHRESVWALVKAAWLGGELVTGEGSAYPDERALAATHEQVTTDADGVADRLWQEADHTARRRGLQANLDRVLETQSEEREASQRAKDDTEAVYKAWCSAWPDLRLPQSPGALRQWAVLLDQLRSLQAASLKAKLAHRGAFRSLRSHRRRLVEVLEAHDVEMASGLDLGPVIARARRILEYAEDTRQQRAGYEKRLRTLERDLPKMKTALAQAETAKRKANEAFLSLLGPFAGNVTTPQEAGVQISRLAQLEGQLDEFDSRVKRIEGIDGRAKAFESEVDDLLAVARDIAPDPPADAARELVRRVKAVRDAHAARETMIRARSDAQDALDAAEDELKGLGDQLALLAEEGDLHEVDTIGEVAERSVSVAALDIRIAESEDVLANQGGGRSIVVLESAGQGTDLAGISVKIEECKRLLQIVSEEESDAIRAETELARDLDLMDGSDDAAAEALRAQRELSAALEGAGRYVRVVLARYIAEEAIRRYSEMHQDPLLERASAYLELLTEGSCVRVGVGEKTKNGPLLSAVRPSGEELSVPELSDGTRDQLYFALRLAAIEESLVRNGPMPVVLDDVLVNFDDDRARTALGCLATLAASTQVLLFTHHRHVFQLAQDTLSPGDRVIHELSPA